MAGNKELLTGKSVLVTGSSRGIGRAIALSFAHEGANVAVTYHSHQEEASLLSRDIKKSGVDSLCVHLDVTKRENIKESIGAVVRQWNGLDILINNAGYLEQKPFQEISDDDWDYTMAVNLKGVFLCIQESAPYFQQQKSGCIINISSVGGQTGGPNAPHYAAAKAGVISLTRSMARLLSPFNVRVNAIAPGFIRTDIYDDIVSRSSEEKILSQIPLARIGTPEDVAEAALFLASASSSYITGHVLNVNGGLFFG
jgi:3-oxoacyl-[acyl-carrier protein] reductase